MDMSAVIVPKSDQINADDLLAGPRTIKITRVELRPGSEQPVSIFFDGDNGKPWKPCKSMARVLVYVWGADANNYVGRSLTLYCDKTVKWGGMEVGGIRISHMSHMPDATTMALTATKGSRKPFTVRPLVVAEPDPPAPIDPEVRESGEYAASQGVESYKQWLAGLSADVKASIRPMHAAWSKIAKEVG